MTLRELRAKCRAICGLPEPPPAPLPPPAIDWTQWVVDDVVRKVRNPELYANSPPVYGAELAATPVEELERRQREQASGMQNTLTTPPTQDPSPHR